MARPMDVAESVGEVVAAFDKAINLVRRVEDRKDGKNDIESIRDLNMSLMMGQTIVKGSFDADSKRLGHAFAIGDFPAQMQMRDILLHLKTLVGDLQEALLDEKPLDFRILQDASDNCRTNAAVCLGQLSQRMASARIHNPMFMQAPQAYVSGVPPMPAPLQSPGLQHSDSRSTRSSVGPNMPRTPDQFPPQWNQKRPDSDGQYSPPHQRKSTESSLQENFANWPVAGQYGDSDDKLGQRKPSSQALTTENGALISPSLPQDRPPLLPGQLDSVRDSYNSFSSDPQLSRQSTQSSHQSRQRFGPDDYDAPDAKPSPQNFRMSRVPFGPDDYSHVEPSDDLFSSKRGSTRSVTSFSSRPNKPMAASPGADHVATPAPLRLGNRNPSQPVRQVSSGNAVPLVQSSPTAGSVQPVAQAAPILAPVDGHRPSVQPQAQSMAVPYGSSPPGQFPPSQSLQGVLTDNQARQHSIGGAFPFTTQGVPQQPPSVQQTAPTTAQVSAFQPQPAPLQPASADPPLSPRPSIAPSIAPSITPSTRTDSIISLPRPMSVSGPRNVPLSLPTEKNTQAFCKGACRLFLGQKKAIIPANRPIGMTSVQPYWRCDKCLFEGPMHSMPGPPDKKGRPGKPEKVFDQTARECGPLSTAIVGLDGRGEGSGGIRFKWAFLAKCHVPMRKPPDRQDGTAGDFCCIFCVAEGSSRGWLVPTQTFNDAASTFSGSSGTARVFGGLTSFMDHLQMHRREEMWPCEEMRNRMKCIVGRVAARSEEWEVNFLPLAS